MNSDLTLFLTLSMASVLPLFLWKPKSILSHTLYYLYAILAVGFVYVGVYVLEDRLLGKDELNSANQLVYWLESSDVAVAIRNFVFSIMQSLTGHYCAIVSGTHGGLYYRYWAAGENCNAPPDKMMIAGAVEAVFNRLQGRWDYNKYCVRMDNNGEWIGMLMVGTNKAVHEGSCGGQYRAVWDAGLKSFKVR